VRLVGVEPATRRIQAQIQSGYIMTDTLLATVSLAVQSTNPFDIEFLACHSIATLSRDEKNRNALTLDRRV
jgi:hypothetical protein